MMEDLEEALVVAAFTSKLFIIVSNEAIIYNGSPLGWAASRQVISIIPFFTRFSPWLLFASASIFLASTPNSYSSVYVKLHSTEICRLALLILLGKQQCAS